MILNSNFSVIPTTNFGANSCVLLESRGGKKIGPSARNPDYSKQLTRILKLLKKHKCIIVRIEVASQVAYRKGGTRKLTLSYPIRMAQVTSIDGLRKDIQTAQRNLVQRPGASGGNTTKRICIWIKVGPLVPAIGLSTLLTES